jgi:polyhydroxyalkanoate synthase subunit PhaC
MTDKNHNKGTKPPSDVHFTDEAMETSQRWARIAERSQRLMSDFMSRNSANLSGPTDSMNAGKAFLELTTQLMADPARMMQRQFELWQGYMSLWHSMANRMMGMATPQIMETPKGDRRFKDDAWTESLVFDFVRQSYLLSARYVQNVVGDVEGLDKHTKQKIDFLTRQFVDALSPSNFLLTNPEVLRATLDSKGENLVKGLENLLRDLERGEGRLRISQTDETAFEVGRDLAITPGKVVFQNAMLQLIQYDPTTADVAKRPLLVIPPWINKFYILDLKPKNSFVKWATDQGQTVFVVSWVNPTAEYRNKTFEDYMFEGILASVDAIEKATGQPEVNAIGYCIGGSLLAGTLAYMKAKGDTRIKSATFFTTLIDFEEAGELRIFVDDDILQSLEREMEEKGFLDGRTMASTFNSLRANDLIWSFVVSNYLLGKEPFPFDLLYWNSDSTRMPCAMHSWYLRNFYLENKLIQPGGITLGGVPIDLRTIDVPIFIVSTREDHIAPWKATYVATQVYSGPVKFVLAGSGHIAGVINPPTVSKYGYWVNTKRTADPDTWLQGATQHDGSWWPEWAKWVGKHAGGKVPARTPGDGGLKVLEAAPGSYVQVRCD